MPPNNAQEEWRQYREHELTRLTPLLQELGTALLPEQVHMSGERYLMSGRKLVLLGTRKDGAMVVIKISSDESGRKEIEQEHQRMKLLASLPFAYQPFLSPEELIYKEIGGLRLLITRYIKEEKGFLEYSLNEQFALALGAFKTQEGSQITAYAHARAVRSTFDVADADTYLASFVHFKQAILASVPDKKTAAVLDRAENLLSEQREIIEQYSGFLTHADFVPHNMRVTTNGLYLLDQSSLRFGNKYESWARFLNYMLVYNPALEHALSEYVRLNRTEEEFLSLRLMRVYKLGFLLRFYADSLSKTSGDLHALAELRIQFWTDVLEHLLDKRGISHERVMEYEEQRNGLRSEEEKRRQRELRQLR